MTPAHIPDAVAVSFLLGVGTGVLIDRYVIPWCEGAAEWLAYQRLRFGRRRRGG